MSWQLLVGLSVLLFSINGLLHRVLMKDDASDPYAQTVAFSGLVGFFAFVIVLFQGGLQPFTSLQQFLLFLPMVALGSCGTLCVFKGLKLVEASEYSILLTSSRLWFMAGTLLFLGEAFSLQKIIGGVLVIVGVIIAQWNKGKFVINTGAFYILLAAFLYASADVISFIIVRNFDAASLIVYGCMFVVISFLIIRPKTIKKLSFYKTPKRGINIIIVSLNDSLASIFVFMAYQIGRNALQIGPLSATQTLVTVLLSWIILRDTTNVPQKILGAIVTVVGSSILL